MYKLIPIFSIIFNFIFIYILEITLSVFVPQDLLVFNHFVRTVSLYFFLILFLYTPLGQRVVAFFARGRNIIGREERIIEPILKDLKDSNMLSGFSTPVYFQFKFLKIINSLTFQKIKKIENRIKKMKYEYRTGTIKIFAYDSLDIETNSYGNSIFISKGALDTLSPGELKAVIFNETAQIKHNISNKRLLHDASVLMGRISALLLIILFPFACITFFFKGSLALAFSFNAPGITPNSFWSIYLGLFIGFIIGLIRILMILALKRANINFTQLPYMFYEREIFISADEETYEYGFAEDMLLYLEKLYVFKLNPKDLGKLFAELRPLVAYRINYFENLLGKNNDLLEENFAWSSNYIKRVQTISNNKI